MDWQTVGVGLFEFAKSPGLAGTGALVAAGVAYWSSRRQRLWDQWWSRTEWALDKACSEDRTVSTVGLAALSNLVTEPRISQSMKEWLRSAVDQFQPMTDPEESTADAAEEVTEHDVDNGTEGPVGEADPR